MSRQHGPNAARISRHVAAGLAGIVLALPAAARADASGPAPSVLLIGNSGYTALPKLSGCLPAMRTLSGRLRAKGANVSEQFDASGPSLRAAIGSFDVHLAQGQKAAIVYCGYVAADADKLFILPVGATSVQPADLPRQAIIARTLSRVLSGHDSLLVAEMHPAPGAPDLANAVQGLREASGMSTYLDLRTVAGDGSPQIDAFNHTVERSAGWPYQAGAGTGTEPPQAAMASATASATPDAATGSAGTDAATAEPGGRGSTAPGSPATPSGPAEGEASSASSGAPASTAMPPTVQAARPVPARPFPDRIVAAKPVPASSPSAKPASDKAGRAEPETAASSAGPATGSGTTRPGASKPDTSKLDTSKPEASRPQPSRTDTAKADASKPDAAKPDVAKPDVANSGTPDAAASSPTTPRNQKPPQVAARDAQPGSPSIRHLQVSLLALGYYNNRIDGLASPATQAAVRAYQKSLKHPQTGFLTYGESTELAKVGARR